MLSKTTLLILLFSNFTIFTSTTRQKYFYPSYRETNSSRLRKKLPTDNTFKKEVESFKESVKRITETLKNLNPEQTKNCRSSVKKVSPNSSQLNSLSDSSNNLSDSVNSNSVTTPTTPHAADETLSRHEYPIIPANRLSSLIVSCNQKLLL